MLVCAEGARVSVVSTRRWENGSDGGTLAWSLERRSSDPAHSVCGVASVEVAVEYRMWCWWIIECGGGGI